MLSLILLDTISHEVSGKGYDTAHADPNDAVFSSHLFLPSFSIQIPPPHIVSQFRPHLYSHRLHVNCLSQTAASGVHSVLR
jgi:hypothetical protein